MGEGEEAEFLFEEVEVLFFDRGPGRQLVAAAGEERDPPAIVEGDDRAALLRAERSDENLGIVLLGAEDGRRTAVSLEEAVGDEAVQPLGIGREGGDGREGAIEGKFLEARGDGFPLLVEGKDVSKEGGIGALVPVFEVGGDPRDFLLLLEAPDGIDGRGDRQGEGPLGDAPLLLGKKGKECWAASVGKSFLGQLDDGPVVAFELHHVAHGREGPEGQ